MKARWAMIALAVALGLSACDTDDFGTVGSGLPTDVSQDSLLIEGPPLQFLAVETVVPDTLQSFDERSRLFMGTRASDNFRATPVLRFDFDPEVLRANLLAALLLQTASDDAEGIAVAQAFTDTVTFTEAMIDVAELQLEVLARDLAREQDEDDPGRQKFPRPVRIHETSRAVTGADAARVASVSEVLGTEIASGSVQSTGAPEFAIALPVARVVEWIDAGAHDGLLIYDLDPGTNEYFFPNESNLIGFASQSSVSDNPPEILFEIDEMELPDRGYNDVAFTAPVELDWTIIEQDAALMDEPMLGSHRVRRTWIQLDLGPDVLPQNATVNRAVMTWFPRQDLSIGTVETGVDSTRLTVYCYESTRAEATRESPRVTNSSENLIALDFVGQSGVAPALGDTLQINVTRYVQRVVNSIVDPEETGLLIFFGAELTDFDTGVYYGPSVADTSLTPRVRVTYTPPADSWR